MNNPRSNNRSRRSGGQKNIILAAVMGVVLLLISGAICLTLLSGGPIRLGGQTIETTQASVDLSSSGITSAAELERLQAPEYIDLRGNSIPPEEIASLKAKHPDCTVLWSVPICGGLVDSDTAALTLTGMTAEQVPLLAHFDRLESVDARGLDMTTVRAILDLSLGCPVLWDIGLGGSRYTSDATEVVVAADATDEEIANLALFDNLQTVDARGCTRYEALAQAAADLPGVSVVWSVPFGPVEGLSTDEVLDFARTPVTDIEELDKAFENLRHLPSLTRVDMCGCGVPSEQMAKWRDKYPQYKFVWEITITLGKEEIVIPTDIKVFSSLRTPYGPQGTQETYKEIFLYCTDLVALDLGHNRISDVSLITNLKKLQAVILMDNPIKDFSPLGELPELVFAEINKTKFKDLSFVKGCPKLMHLDISETPTKNISMLHECKNLEYLVLVLGNVKQHEYDALKKNLPGCTIAWVYADYYAVRNSPLRSAYRNAFTNYTKIETFNDWTDYSFVDGSDIKKPSGYKPPEYYGDDAQP